MYLLNFFPSLNRTALLAVIGGILSWSTSDARSQTPATAETEKVIASVSQAKIKRLGPTMADFDVVLADENGVAGEAQQILDLIEFVDRYIKSGESDKANIVEDFYSDHVHRYFGKTTISINDVVTDRQAFLKRWPRRTYVVKEAPRVVKKTISGIYVVDVGFDYTVANGPRVVRGHAFTTLKIRVTNDGFRIFSAEESD